MNKRKKMKLHMIWIALKKSTGCTNISATKYNYAIEFVIDGFNTHYLVSGANYDLSCTNKGETKIL